MHLGTWAAQLCGWHFSFISWLHNPLQSLSLFQTLPGVQGWGTRPLPGTVPPNHLTGERASQLIDQDERRFMIVA